MLRLLWPLLFLPLLYFLWLALHAAPAALRLANGAEMQWVDCWFDRPLFSRPVHCGRLLTSPESGEKPDQFSLPVVYVPAFFWHRTQPPILYIAGGPGGATGLDAEGVSAWLGWLGWVNWPADTIFYDQRGVGLSRPSLACPEVLDRRRELLVTELPSEEKYQQARAAGQACLQRLQSEGWNLQRFNTLINAGDTRDLIDSLGLDAWQLYGVSYGTRVALQIMRGQPPGLRAVILDSLYPPLRHAEKNDAWLLNRSLRMFTRSCQFLADCDFSPERLNADLRHIFKQLELKPLKVKLKDRSAGEIIDVAFGRDDLAWLIFESQYLWSNIALLPAAVTALADGRITQEMQQMMQESIDNLLDDSLSEAVFSSVDCADNGDFSRQQAEQALQQFPLVATIKQHDWRYSACRYWDSGDTGSVFRRPVVSDVPTLLLAGEFDPVTPPEWAEDSLSTLSSAYLFIAPGIGHGVLDSDDCTQHLTQAFLQNPLLPAVPDCLRAW